MDKLQIKEKKLPLGFTFSFPCHQTKLDEVWRVEMLSRKGTPEPPAAVGAVAMRGFCM
jgi:hypothetical protein